MGQGAVEMIVAAHHFGVSLKTRQRLHCWASVLQAFKSVNRFSLALVQSFAFVLLTGVQVNHAVVSIQLWL